MNSPTLATTSGILDTSPRAMSATPASGYVLKPPSPPHVHVPPVSGEDKLVLPDFRGVTGDAITNEDLKTITQGHHVATDRITHWRYEWRRQAQPITPFLYLGPFTATKDRDFLRTEGITMLLAVRDVKTAQAKLLNADKVAEELGIVSASVDVSGTQELIAAFPKAVRIINDHLLTVYRQQGLRNQPLAAGGSITIDKRTFQRGKVLVFCESGNERSACVVVAYLMSMYGEEIVRAIQFVSQSRFCVAFDDPLKDLLLSYQDILQARRDVSQSLNQPFQTPSVGTIFQSSIVVRNNKRQYHEIATESDNSGDHEMEDVGMDSVQNGAEEHRRFAPFVDNDRVG